MGTDMAAPLTKRQTQHHIDSIQTSKLIKRVTEHVLDGAEMSATQLRGAEILLNKTMGNMSQVAIDVEGELGVSVTILGKAD